MTAREYLSQAGQLEQRIAGNMRRAEAMRALAASVSSPAADAVRVLSFSSGEAPFIRASGLSTSRCVRTGCAIRRISSGST